MGFVRDRWISHVGRVERWRIVVGKQCVVSHSYSAQKIIILWQTSVHNLRDAIGFKWPPNIDPVLFHGSLNQQEPLQASPYRPSSKSDLLLNQSPVLRRTPLIDTDSSTFSTLSYNVRLALYGSISPSALFWLFFNYLLCYSKQKREMRFTQDQTPFIGGEGQAVMEEVRQLSSFRVILAHLGHTLYCPLKAIIIYGEDHPSEPKLMMTEFKLQISEDRTILRVWGEVLEYVQDRDRSFFDCLSMEKQFLNSSVFEYQRGLEIEGKPLGSENDEVRLKLSGF